MKTLSEQEKALAAAREEVINKCGYFEKLLLANKKKGFFTGDKVTLIKKSVSLMVVEILLIAMLFVRYFGMLKKRLQRSSCSLRFPMVVFQLDLPALLAFLFARGQKAWRRSNERRSREKNPFLSRLRRQDF